jgi:hypothetical protein
MRARTIVCVGLDGKNSCCLVGWCLSSNCSLPSTQSCLFGAVTLEVSRSTTVNS